MKWNVIHSIYVIEDESTYMYVYVEERKKVCALVCLIPPFSSLPANLFQHDAIYTALELWFLCLFFSFSMAFLSHAEDGELVPLPVTSGFSGAAASNGLSISGTVDGKWLAISPEGSTVPAGYFHFTTLEIASLKATGCDPGSFGLIDGVVVNQEVCSIVGGQKT